MFEAFIDPQSIPTTHFLSSHKKPQESKYLSILTKRTVLGSCSNHYIFGDLENDLREEIVDAFQDIRVSPGTEVIKQGDVADNFYIIVRFSRQENTKYAHKNKQFFFSKAPERCLLFFIHQSCWSTRLHMSC
jgi:hypothetical protein